MDAYELGYIRPNKDLLLELSAYYYDTKCGSSVYFQRDEAKNAKLMVRAFDRLAGSDSEGSLRLFEC